MFGVKLFPFRRMHNLDKEVAASGFTKEMEKDLQEVRNAGEGAHVASTLPALSKTPLFCYSPVHLSLTLQLYSPKVVPRPASLQEVFLITALVWLDFFRCLLYLLFVAL